MTAERTAEQLATEMAEALLHVAVFFRLEAWERDLNDEEMSLARKVENALDNPIGKAARKAEQDAREQAFGRMLETVK